MKKGFKILRNVLIVVVILIVIFALFCCILFPGNAKIDVTGSYEVETADYTWVDEDREETYSDAGEKRAVTLRVWYPREEGTYPLVVFSHGATGGVQSNESTCRELASHGYVAVTIAHPYQAIFVKDVNGKITLIDQDFLKQVMTDNGFDDPEHEAAVYKMSQEWLAIRCGDANFVLDTILEKAEKREAPFDRVNPEKIGFFGHSLGGATAVQLGRERTDLDAVIDLEGTMLGEYVGYEDGEYIFNEEPYPIPVLDVNSKAVYEEAKSIDGREYVNFYLGRHAVDYREAVFYDAGHLNFTDLPTMSPILGKAMGAGEVDARACIENVNEMVLHYFDYYLKDAETLDILEEYDH